MALVCASALLGAILGGVITGRISPHYTAVTLVQGAPARLDPSSLTQEDDRYAQTEAAYAGLVEPEIAAALADQEQLSGARAAEVSVVPGTTILRFTAAGDTAEEAVTAANISAETYVEAWRERSTAALTESLAVLDRTQVDPAQPSPLLAEQRALLDTQLTAVQSLQRVVKPASAATSEQGAGFVTGAILGALVGLTAGLLLVLWARHASSAGGTER